MAGGPNQSGPARGDSVLVICVVLVVLTAIGGLVWIALAIGQESGTVAPAAITAISTIVLATIGAISTALRRRPARSNR